MTTIPKKVWLTGLLAGTLDITAACIQYSLRTGRNPVNVLRFVASGLFGKEALTGGTSMALAGLAIHYLIAITWTLFFYFVVCRIRIFQANRFITGLLYGAFVWAVMNRIVLPLTQAPPLKQSLTNALQAMGILMVCIGFPLAFILLPKKERT